MIKIVVDSTADVPESIRAEYNITVVPILLQFGNQTFRDNIDLPRDEFYRRLVESNELPRTAAPSVGMFAETFRQLTADGSEVLSISVAGDLSGTYNAARQGAAMIEKARIVCVDSRTVAMPITYLAVAAARAAREGRTLDEIAAMLEQLRERAVVIVAVDTLQYLEKGGRIGRVRALLGTLLNVKPIFEVRDCVVQPIEQVRTWKRAPARMVEIAQQRGAFSDLSVLYTTDRARAEELADLCTQAGLAQRERISIGQVSAALGTHVGPGALGLTGLLAHDSTGAPAAS